MGLFMLILLYPRVTVLMLILLNTSKKPLMGAKNVYLYHIKPKTEKNRKELKS